MGLGRGRILLPLAVVLMRRGAVVVTVWTWLMDIDRGYA
jgi:hypothetical protein